MYTKIILSFLMFVCFEAFASSSVSVSFKSDKDGYMGDLDFRYGFNNCYGKISLAFGNETLKANGYIYENKVYSPSDLALTEFKKSKINGLTIAADVYEHERLLGRAEFKNVTFFSGVGCFSETYPVIEMLGLKNSDFKESFKSLSLRNVNVSGIARNYKIEDLIIKKSQAEKEKEKKQLQQPQPAETTATKKDLKQKDSTIPSSAKVENKNSGSSSEKSAAPAQKNAPSTPNIGDSLAKQEEEFKKTQSEAKDMSDKVSGVAGGFTQGIRGTGDGFGLSLLADNANDSNSPFTPFFLGLVFGKASDPNLEENSKAWLSGVQIQAAFNMEWLESDPQTYTYDKFSKNNRRWEILLEGKFFTNFTALGSVQPYLAIGYASYSDFNRRNKNIGTDWSLTKGFGIGFVGSHGIFNIGINQDINALDIGFIFHQ